MFCTRISANQLKSALCHKQSDPTGKKCRKGWGSHFLIFTKACAPMKHKPLKQSKTRESADSPPCNCRQLFSAMLKLKCSKPCVFHIFHLSKAFSKVHFVLRGPIQNSANAFSSRRNTQFFFTSGKKVGNLYFEVTCAC